jgi:aminopeptidase-like protein
MDDIKFISSQKLNQTLSVYKKLVKYIDNYVTYKAVYKCEPQLSKRNLYSSYGSRFVNINSKNLLNFLMYADGNNTIEEISNHIKLPHAEVIKIRDTLLNNKLVCEI